MATGAITTTCAGELLHDSCAIHRSGHSKHVTRALVVGRLHFVCVSVNTGDGDDNALHAFARGSDGGNDVTGGKAGKAAIERIGLLCGRCALKRNRVGDAANGGVTIVHHRHIDIARLADQARHLRDATGLNHVRRLHVVKIDIGTERKVACTAAVHSVPYTFSRRIDVETSLNVVIGVSEDRIVGIVAGAGIVVIERISDEATARWHGERLRQSHPRGPNITAGGQGHIVIGDAHINIGLLCCGRH